MGPTDTFDRYASVYDLFYQEKAYDTECDFLEAAFLRWSDRPVRRVLDLGCGTAGHAIPLAKRGYEVLGVDRSRPMLDVAERKTCALDLGGRLRFVQADAADLSLHESFDAVVCMFAVLSYQTTDDQLANQMLSARRSLREGGLFIADFWYGPAVMAQRPQSRTLVVNGGESRTVRTATPNWDAVKHRVSVRYQVQTRVRDTLSNEISETHCLRYFFLPELLVQLHQAGFRLVHVCSFPTLDEPASVTSWNVALIAQATDHRGPPT